MSSNSLHPDRQIMRPEPSVPAWLHGAAGRIRTPDPRDAQIIFLGKEFLGSELATRSQKQDCPEAQHDATQFD